MTDEREPIAYLSITNTLAWLVGVTVAVAWAAWRAPMESTRYSLTLAVSAVLFGAVALALLALSVHAVMGRPGLFVRDGRLIFSILWSSDLADIRIVSLEKMHWLAGNVIFVRQKNGQYRTFPLFVFRTPAHEILRRLAAVGAPVEGYWPVAGPTAKVEDSQTP